MLLMQLGCCSRTSGAVGCERSRPEGIGFSDARSLVPSLEMGYELLGMLKV